MSQELFFRPCGNMASGETVLDCPVLTRVPGAHKKGVRKVGPYIGDIAFTFPLPPSCGVSPKQGEWQGKRIWKLSTRVRTHGTRSLPR